MGPGQILAFQATFSPTGPGTFNGSMTFNTSGGSAIANLTGTATAGGPSPGVGLVSITVAPDIVVPGNRLEIRYEIRRESLTGPVDLYAVVVLSSGESIFLTETGTSTNLLPLRRNVPAADDTVTLFEFVPVDIPFGTYRFYMALIQAGRTASLDTLASPVDTATFTFAPRQPRSERRSSSGATRIPRDVLDRRDTPEAGAVALPVPRAHRAVWVNGKLDSSGPPSSPPPGGALRVDPALFTPLTSRAQLVATFGQPTAQSTATTSSC